MGIVYHTITENINKRTFRVIIPGDYEPVIHSYYREDGMDLLYNNEGESSISYLPIKDLIDMSFKQVEFTLCKPEDLSTIVQLLDEYIKQMNPYRQQDQDLAIFLERCELAYHKFNHVKIKKANFIERTTGQSGTKNILQILERMF